jgi:hypothetical protein
MKISIIGNSANQKALFSEIKDRECFYYGGTLYMKILSQDLREYNINNVNAISIINAGLTYFNDDETVCKASKKKFV